MRGPELPKAGGDRPKVPDTQLGLGLPGLEQPAPADSVSAVSRPKDEKIEKNPSASVVIPITESDTLGDQHRAIEAYKRQRSRGNT